MLDAHHEMPAADYQHQRRAANEIRDQMVREPLQGVMQFNFNERAREREENGGYNNRRGRPIVGYELWEGGAETHLYSDLQMIFLSSY